MAQFAFELGRMMDTWDEATYILKGLQEPQRDASGGSLVTEKIKKVQTDPFGQALRHLFKKLDEHLQRKEDGGR